MPLQSPIAPSVTITRKHRAPISSTPRDGKANPLDPCSECADADPSRAVIAHAASHSTPAATRPSARGSKPRSEEHTSELQSRGHLVCRLLLEKKNTQLIPLLLYKPK